MTFNEGTEDEHTEECSYEVIASEIDFRGNQIIESVTFPGSIKSLSGWFAGCTKLHTVILPSQISEIPPLAFAKSAITSIEIPSTVDNIGNEAFSGCKNLSSVNIPEGVSQIPSSAFSGSAPD